MDKLCLILFGTLVLSLDSSCGENKYTHYSLVRLRPHDEAQMAAVHNFQDPDGQVEVLKTSRGYNDSMDLLTPESHRSFIEHFARQNNFELEIKERNYGRSLQPVNRISRRKGSREFNIFGYNSHNSIREYLSLLAATYPNLVSVEHQGKSTQGRSLDLVKISTDPNAQNPIIFIDAGIHAREWAAPALALYIMDRLVKDPEARRRELKGIDWYILPLVNPDGYEFTRASPSNRMWRKTRSKHNSECFGVDGNRNYAFKWGVSGVSNNPCDRETYAGPRPFSEPETKIVKNIMSQNAERIKLYVSLHAYGQYLVYPWGFTEHFLPKSWKKLDHLARLVSTSVERAGGKPFKVLSAGRWYAAAGGSDDYAFGAVGIPYSYTMEITDDYEFKFPERLLKNTLPPFYEGFKTFSEEIKKEFT